MLISISYYYRSGTDILNKLNNKTVFQFHLEMQSKSFVAEDWYNLRILSRVIAAWNEATKKLIIERDKKCYIAQLHYERYYIY